MIKETIWKTFEKTGNLNAYLLLKEIENDKISNDMIEKKEEEALIGS